MNHVDSYRFGLTSIPLMLLYKPTSTDNISMFCSLRLFKLRNNCISKLHCSLVDKYHHQGHLSDFPHLLLPKANAVKHNITMLSSMQNTSDVFSPWWKYLHQILHSWTLLYSCKRKAKMLCTYSPGLSWDLSINFSHPQNSCRCLEKRLSLVLKMMCKFFCSEMWIFG